MRNKGLIINGSFRKAGVTIYSKKGQSIVRSAMSLQPHRRTMAQFEVRESFAHNRRLWKVVRSTGLITYAQFCALAAKLPVLYLTHEEHFSGYTLLVPGTPVACGTLPDIGCRLGTVDGRPALLTDLSPSLLAAGERLTLVTLGQVVFGRQPRLTAAMVDVPLADFVSVDGLLALVDDRFGDEGFGWALVRRRGARCSTQTVVTASRRHLDYTTDDALQRAAASYGGLTAG